MVAVHSDVGIGMADTTLMNVSTSCCVTSPSRLSITNCAWQARTANRVSDNESAQRIRLCDFLVMLIGRVPSSSYEMVFRKADQFPVNEHVTRKFRLCCGGKDRPAKNFCTVDERKCPPLRSNVLICKTFRYSKPQFLNCIIQQT